MIVVRFGADALARVRFAISPLIESQLSVRVLDDPAGQALHLPWAADARRHTADLDLAVLRALQPDDVYSPDFVHPPPTSPLAEIEDELSVMVATPAEQVRAEVRDSCRQRPLPPEALAALLGRSRASVLLALDRPRSTTDLASALGVTAGGASQHLAVLRDAGLVHGHRVGRVVLYLRTPAGDDLLAVVAGQRGQ